MNLLWMVLFFISRMYGTEHRPSAEPSPETPVDWNRIPGPQHGMVVCLGFGEAGRRSNHHDRPKGWRAAQIEFHGSQPEAIRATERNGSSLWRRPTPRIAGVFRGESKVLLLPSTTIADSLDSLKLLRHT